MHVYMCFFFFFFFSRFTRLPPCCFRWQVLFLRESWGILCWRSMVVVSSLRLFIIPIDQIFSSHSTSQSS